jgi:hypothetical protein
VKTVLPSGMLMAYSRAAVAAHFAGSAIVGVAAWEHSSSASRIAVGVSDIGGAASVMASTVGSSTGAGRTG